MSLFQVPLSLASSVLLHLIRIAHIRNIFRKIWTLSHLLKVPPRCDQRFATFKQLLRKALGERYQSMLSTKPGIAIGTSNAIDTFAEIIDNYRNSLWELSPSVSSAIDVISTIAALADPPGSSRDIESRLTIAVSSLATVTTSIHGFQLEYHEGSGRVPIIFRAIDDIGESYQYFWSRRQHELSPRAENFLRTINSRRGYR